MTRERESGRRGEALAERFLISKGYDIITRNFTTRYGEIDIIARDGEETVFAEVKLRHDASFASAAEAVGPRKRKRLRDTALEWLAENGERPARFDVIEIYTKSEKPLIRHIKNAF